MITGSQAAQGGRVLSAVKRSRALSREGALELLFALAFRGLVYPQIWEDPDIDMEALALAPDSRVVTIASGGCNVLAYLLAGPASITAIDLNPAHVALTKLKLTAMTHLPSWPDFFRFFGVANDAANVEAYWRDVAPHLDAQSRAYWERRTVARGGRRRISLFASDFYRHGLLGRCIGMGHLVARAHGVDPRALLDTGSIDEQRRFFKMKMEPLFDRSFVRWLASRRVSLYGLGIPPAQFKLLGDDGNMAAVLRSRLERLICDFPFSENYFAWQAFGRRYPEPEKGPLPPYLRRENFDAIRDRTGRVAVLNRSFTEYLESQADGSLDRYVLLDAQDWMTSAQLDALWTQITRTARPGARVIFRTAAAPSLLPGRLAPGLLAQWRYEADASRQWSARDRSAIYGGFHLYTLA